LSRIFVDEEAALKAKIDMNCDLGESFGAFKTGNDAKIMPYITSANIACGFHAGDPMTIAQTIMLAKRHRVAVGAHPGFPDLVGFGRREMQLTSEEAENYVLYQVSAIQGFAKAVGLRLQHIKPHGALYNMAAKDEELSKAIVKTVRKLGDDLIVFAPPKSALAKVAARAKLRVAKEFFADRAYDLDGSLISRRQKGAIINDPRTVVQRTVTMVKEGTVQALNGEVLSSCAADTICVHGDTSDAVELAKALKKGLVKAGIKVEPAGNFI
jgi:UPF0271 protein